MSLLSMQKKYPLIPAVEKNGVIVNYIQLYKHICLMGFGHKPN